MFTLTRLHRMVLALCLAAVIVPSASAAPTLHLVAFGDSNDPKLGPKLADDAHNIVSAFTRSFERAGRANQLRTHVLVGDDVTPARILATVERLAVQPEDTLVILGSCHGDTDAQVQHRITLHAGILYRHALLAAMKAKKPRLAVLLTDCCSSHANGNPGIHVVPTYRPQELPAGQTIDWRTLNCLFLSHAGVVDITAAEPGFRARVDRDRSGSLFTNALIRVLNTPYDRLIGGLDRDRDGNIQWDELLPQLRGLAARYHEEQIGTAEQQAYAFKLGTWAPMVATLREK
ncbi:MAG: caspase family protein [Gemmataceae bacterium]|nr:caspase family protein [Gemmataceae bacterium]